MIKISKRNIRALNASGFVVYFPCEKKYLVSTKPVELNKNINLAQIYKTYKDAAETLCTCFESTMEGRYDYVDENHVASQTGICIIPIKVLQQIVITIPR